MLFQIVQNNPVQWVGQPLAHIVYPPAIEASWTDAELAAIGLYKLVDPGIPSGKIATASNVQIIAGVPTVVYMLEDAGLPELAPYQFRAMLGLSGKQAALDAFIAALPDPQKTVAAAKLEFSLSFHRENDLVEAARKGLGLSNAELDALWLQAAAIS